MRVSWLTRSTPAMTKNNWCLKVDGASFGASHYKLEYRPTDLANNSSCLSYIDFSYIFNDTAKSAIDNVSLVQPVLKVIILHARRPAGVDK